MFLSCSWHSFMLLMLWYLSQGWTPGQRQEGNCPLALTLSLEEAGRLLSPWASPGSPFFPFAEPCPPLVFPDAGSKASLVSCGSLSLCPPLEVTLDRLRRVVSPVAFLRSHSTVVPGS